MPENGPANERLNELRRRLEDDPQSPIFVQLAEEYRRLGQSEQGLKVLEEGLRRNPNYLSAQVAHARCLLDLDRASLAVPALEGVLAKDPAQLVARKLLVEALVRQSQAMRARRELDLYITLNPSDPEIETLRTRIDDLQLADLVPPKRLVPAPAETAPSVAERLVHPLPVSAPDRSEIVAAVEPFPGLRGPASVAAHLRALAAEGIFSWADAVEEEEEAPALPPAAAVPEVTATLGQLYLSQGHTGEAEGIFRAVLADDPDNLPARQGLERLNDLASIAESPEASVAQVSAAPMAPEVNEVVDEREKARRKVQVLSRYLAGLRRTTGRHVS